MLTLAITGEGGYQPLPGRFKNNEEMAARSSFHILPRTWMVVEYEKGCMQLLQNKLRGLRLGSGSWETKKCSKCHWNLDKCTFSLYFAHFSSKVVGLQTTLRGYSPLNQGRSIPFSCRGWSPLKLVCTCSPTNLMEKWLKIQKSRNLC